MRPLDAAVNGPVCGVLRRWPRTLHAVASDAVGSALSGYTVPGLCGARRLRLAKDGGELVLFPPPNALLDRGYRRCQACWIAAGRPAHRARRSLTRRAS